MVLTYHSGVSADLPLTIEDLITQQNRYRLDISMAYANSDRQRVSSRYQIFEAGNGQFIQLPVSVGDDRRNADQTTPKRQHYWPLQSWASPKTPPSMIQTLSMANTFN